MKSATQLLTTAAKLDDAIDIKDSFSKYEILLLSNKWATIHLLDNPIPTKRELENDLELLYKNIVENNGTVTYYDTENHSIENRPIYSLDLTYTEENILFYGWDVFPSYDYIEFLIINKYDDYRGEAYNLLTFDISFSEWCKGLEFVVSNRHLDNPEIIWMLNLPKWLEKPLDENINRNTNKNELLLLIDNLAHEFNLGNLNQDDVLNVIELIYPNKISDVINFIESIASLTVDYSLFSYLIPIIMDRSKKKVREVKFNLLNSRPYWCDDHIWKLFNDSKCYKGAEIVHQIATALVQKYQPSKYFYVCMARDAVPLYNLLFSMNYDSILGVFSRSQIGDDASVELLKNEIALASELTGKLPVLVDVQGRGTIYDYLREQGLNYEMIFGVSSNPDNCRYPLLIDDESIGNRAIKYIEKLPQSNGRAEGVYQVNRCQKTYLDTLIAWGSRDPNVMGEDMKDWEILQFRGLFMETMGISHVHAGMIGADCQQRMWGILKSRINVSIQLGIKCKDQHIDLIRATRFKSQHEVGHSGGMNDPETRLRDEISHFGNTGIRTIFGIVSDDRHNGKQYGSNFCLVNTKQLLPYITITNRDSLWESGESHFPVTKLNKLPDCMSVYREVQYNTLVTWDSVLEVIPC
jgi:hypothetical protein